jgi:hypothetical protein
VKTIFYEMQPLEETAPTEVYRAPALDVRAGYSGDIVGYDVSTQEPGEAEKTQSTSFPVHHVHALFDIYLSSDKDAALKPYIRAGADIGFALGSPIDSLMMVDGIAGFGLLLDRLEKARLDAHLDYHFRYGLWSDSIVKRPFTMGVIAPIGIGAAVQGHFDAFQATFDLDLSSGSGQRNYDAGGGSDISMTWVETMVFAGVDMVDVFGYNPDLDVAIGLLGGLLWYSEEQTPDQGAAESFATVDGRMGASARVRYVTSGAPRTAFMLDIDALFLGGLVPEFPGIVENKTDLSSRLGNVQIKGAVELRF